MSNGTIGGYAIFTETATNQEAVVPLETRTASSYLLAFDNTGGVATELAIANVGAPLVGALMMTPRQEQIAQTDIPVVIRNDAGAQIGNQAIPLGLDQHTSFLLAPTYAATTNIRGTVEFDVPAGTGISVPGLRAEGAALTTLPLLANVA